MSPPSIQHAESPESVFAFAQSAIAAGDWESFFPCLDGADLRRIAAMVMSLAGPADSGEFAALCFNHGVAAATVERIRAIQADIATSAVAILDPSPSSAQDRVNASFRHRDLVKSHDALVAGAVKEIADLPAFVAAAERFRRRTEGGGSVSSSLFVDEVLVDLVVSGKRASGTRRRTVGGDDPVAFVLGRHGWRIRLFAGRAR